MRAVIAIGCMLVLGQACSHASEPSGSEQARGDTVARSPESAGGEQVCGNAQIYFASGSTDLDQVGRERLDRYSQCLSSHEIDAVYVSGTTDPTGTDEENIALGRSRARVVADYLHDNGCHVDFVIRSFGERDALAEEVLWPLDRAADVTAVAGSH